MEHLMAELAEASNRIDMLDIALASGALTPEREARLRDELEQERRKIVELERALGLRSDSPEGPLPR